MSLKFLQTFNNIISGESNRFWIAMNLTLLVYTSRMPPGLINYNNYNLFTGTSTCALYHAN